MLLRVVTYGNPVIYVLVRPFNVALCCPLGCQNGCQMERGVGSRRKFNGTLIGHNTSASLPPLAQKLCCENSGGRLLPTLICLGTGLIHVRVTVLIFRRNFV